MRTIKELQQAALIMRAKILSENKNPHEATFTISEDEYCLMRMEPLSNPTIDFMRNRFCGMKLHCIGTCGKD